MALLSGGRLTPIRACERIGRENLSSTLQEKLRFQIHRNEADFRKPCSNGFPGIPRRSKIVKSENEATNISGGHAASSRVSKREAKGARKGAEMSADVRRRSMEVKNGKRTQTF